mmetsp:Transcript_14542/g.63017  ORF Transcript_14542/g.63017 Transcript_14542/m.63017 type:complete len:206 (+) Transcript_14542:2029-2646(+)
MSSPVTLSPVARVRLVDNVSRSKAARTHRFSAHVSARSPPSASASTTSAFSVSRHRAGGGCLADAGRSAGRSGPVMGAHSTARTNIVSSPRHCARASTASGGCLAMGSPAMAAARATPAGCGGGGTVTTRTSALVARCPQRPSHESSSPESSPPDDASGVPRASFGARVPGDPPPVARTDPPVELSRARSLCFNRAMSRTPSAVS